MIPIIFSCVACIGWGTADFIGGIKSRHLPISYILWVSAIVGTVMIGLFIGALQPPFPDDPDMIWAIPAGISGTCAMFLLYRGLSVGTMTVIAPISAMGVIFPVLFGIYLKEPVSGFSYVGMAIAVTGAILAMIEKNSPASRKKLTKGVEYAMASALFIGLYFIFMDKAGNQYPLWASLVMRATTLIVLIPVLIFIRRSRTKPVRLAEKNRFGISVHLPWVILMGAADTIAGVAFVAATSNGLLGEVAVISSLYPAVTIALSFLLLKERVSILQASGVILALAGMVLIATF